MYSFECIQNVFRMIYMDSFTCIINGLRTTLWGRYYYCHPIFYKSEGHIHSKEYSQDSDSRLLSLRPMPLPAHSPTSLWLHAFKTAGHMPTQVLVWITASIFLFPTLSDSESSGSPVPRFPTHHLPIFMVFHRQINRIGREPKIIHWVLKKINRPTFPL